MVERSLIMRAAWLASWLLPALALEFSTEDGTGNNRLTPDRGAIGDVYISPPMNSYADGLGTLPPMPSARAISNAIGMQLDSAGTSTHSVAMLAWGQTIAHDVGDMPGNGSEPVHVPVPSCDGAFDAQCEGDKELGFHRAQVVPGPGRRSHINLATTWIDASWLYFARTVREMVGGRLSLPNNAFPDEGPDIHEGHTNCKRPMAGDPRAIENPGLVTMYLVFAREHNRICAELAGQNPAWSDERLFQEARMRVIALTQKVTLEEYAPNLLGTVLKDDSTYDPTVDPRIDVLFATAAYRYGHSAAPAVYQVGDEMVMLRDGQFNPCLCRDRPDDVIHGMPRTAINTVDSLFVRDLRDFLKTGPSHNLGANDLFSRNIQRGRDCGLPRFNAARAHLGLPRKNSFFDVAGLGGADIAIALAQLYDSVDDVDFYVGGLLEEKEIDETGQGSEELGVTFATVIRDQFQRLRRGDRFWYEWQPVLAAFVKDRTLQNIFEDNTPGLKLTKSPFLLHTDEGDAGDCEDMLDTDPSVDAVPRVELLAKMNIVLEWKVETEAVELTVLADIEDKDAAWFSVGFGPSTGNMKDTDYIVVKVAAGACSVGDYWGEQHAQEPVEDSGEASFESTCEVSGGSVTAVVKRALAATDAQDFAFNLDEQNVIAAGALAPWPAYHGTNRGGAVIAPGSGGVSMAADGGGGDVMFRIHCGHAVLMILLFAFGYPFVIIMAIFFRHKPWGFKLHTLVGQMGTGVLYVNMIMMTSTSSRVSAHAFWGFTTASSALLVAAFGFLLEYAPKIVPHFNRVRHIAVSIHKGFGYVTMLVSPLTMWIGFKQLRPFESPILEGSPVVWMLPMLVLLPSSLGEFFWRRSRKEITWQDWQKLNNAGRSLMVVNSFIIDIDAFGDQHPGGKDVLKPWVGKDATDVFYGLATYKDKFGNSRMYQHSKPAEKMLMRARVGMVTNWLHRINGGDAGAEFEDVVEAVGDVKRREANLKVYEMYLSDDPVWISKSNHKWFRFHSTSPAFAAHSMTFLNPTTGLSRDYSPVGVVLLKAQLYVDFIIKIYDKGAMTQWLDSLHRGDLVLCREPCTTSISSPTLHGCWQQLLAFVAGTGITPMLNLLSRLTDNLHEDDLRTRCRVVLVWWIPTMNDFFLNQATMQLILKQLEGRIFVRIQLTQSSGNVSLSDQDSWLNGLDGLTLGSGRDMEGCMRWGIQKLQYDPSFSGRVFLCGTPGFNDASHAGWKKVAPASMTYITHVL